LLQISKGRGLANDERARNRRVVIRLEKLVEYGDQSAVKK
jgi:hypothetical protein